MVAIARVQCPDAEFQEADAESLPFEDARFDAVVCSLGILHFPKPATAVGEVFRVLKSGGRYVFTCWKPPAANPFMALILGSIQAHGTLSVGGTDFGCIGDYYLHAASGKAKEINRLRMMRKS
jgi:ubiquinone/menaquinone biosynthesis C-methylase UbiE